MFAAVAIASIALHYAVGSISEGSAVWGAAGMITPEDKHMTRTELEINQKDMWRMLHFEQQTTLTLAVEMLLRCHLSPEQILTKTAVALEGSHHDS